MKFNLSITNEGALPLPFATLVGDKFIRTETVWKDHPIHMNAFYITGTPAGQVRIHGKDCDVVVDPTKDLLIRLHNEPDTTTN